MCHSIYEENRGICGPQKTQLQSAVPHSIAPSGGMETSQGGVYVLYKYLNCCGQPGLYTLTNTSICTP